MHGFTFKFKIWPTRNREVGPIDTIWRQKNSQWPIMVSVDMVVADIDFPCGHWSIWFFCCGRDIVLLWPIWLWPIWLHPHGRSESDRLTTATIEKSLHFYFGKHWQKMQHRKRQLEVNAEMWHGDFGECNFNIFMLLQPLRNAQHSL